MPQKRGTILKTKRFDLQIEEEIVPLRKRDINRYEIRKTLKTKYLHLH